MPSSLKIFARHNLAVVTHSGVLRPDEVSAVFDSFRTHPDARPGLLMLVDLRPLERFDADVIQFFKLQMSAAEIFTSHPQEMIMCFFCPPGPNSRLARAIIDAWEAVPTARPKLAETEEQAISILGLPVSRLSQITDEETSPRRWPF